MNKCLVRGELSGACVAACPAKAIALADVGAGGVAPFIDPCAQPCLVCRDLACTQACSSGALQPLTSAKQIAIGTAVIDPARCTAYRGLPCRICFELCPVPEVLTLVPGARAYVPVAGPEACIGCGQCAHHCPAEGALLIEPLQGLARQVQVLDPGV